MLSLSLHCSSIFTSLSVSFFIIYGISFKFGANTMCMCTSSGNSTLTCKYQSCPVQAAIVLITSRGKQSAASSLWCKLLPWWPSSDVVIHAASIFKPTIILYPQRSKADSVNINKYTKECVEQLCHTKFKRSDSIKVCYGAQQFKTTDDIVPQGYTPHHSLTPAH